MKQIPAHRVALLGLFAFALATHAWVLDYVVLLQYESPASYFVFDRQFLSQWLDHPGGLMLYAGRFLRQFFRYAWLGALVVASLAASLGLLLHGIRSRLAPRPTLFYTLVPCLFVVALYSASTLTVGLLAVGAAYLFYLCLPGPRAARGFAALATPLLYLAAGGHVWLFVVWVTLSEWLDRTPRRRVFGCLYPIGALCLPLLTQRWLFPISMRAAWLSSVDVPHALLERLFLAYVLLVPVWPRLPLGRRLLGLVDSARGRWSEAVAVAGLAVLLVAASYDASTRRFADYQRLYQRGQWERILEQARRHPSADVMTQFFTNCALLHKGQLLDRMFAYPQPWGTSGLVLYLPDHAAHLRQAMYDSDLYLELGHVNAAYRMAFNQFGFEGPTYANMRRMVECSAANGDVELAMKYVRILERTLFHRGFAERYRALLADPAAAARQFAPLRALRPTVELDVNLGEFAALLTLVKSNPANHMALEYLTAWCLLDKAALPFVVDNLQRFHEAGYAVLPIHCQEALLLWEGLSGVPVERRGFAYNAGVGARFARFEQQLRQVPSIAEALRALEPGFGSTYMYYYEAVATPLQGDPSWAWYRLGNELYAMGDRDEAEACFQQALLKHPEDAQAYPRLGSGPGATPEHGAAAPGAESEWQLRSH